MATIFEQSTHTDTDTHTTIDGKVETVETVPVFRFNLTKSFMDELQRFAQCHRHDLADDYKNAWDEWCEANEETIDSEKRRLKQLGYVGNADDKIYKSARYYFRNKSTQKKLPVSRRAYISMERETLDAIDTHIVSVSVSVSVNNGQQQITTPAEGFTDFCQKYPTEITEGAKKLMEQGMQQEEIINKFKKTYKNRYFTYTRRIAKNAAAEAAAAEAAAAAKNDDRADKNEN